MTRAVRISAPCRLHFGLLRFGENVGASFGGLGMMVDQPRVEVDLQPAPQWQAVGPMADRALEFAHCVSRSAKLAEQTPMHIRVCNVPPAHCGLGSGTQLALAVAHGIYKLQKLPTPAADQLAASVGRGKRSAVGSHGFLHGGLIWETGQEQADTLGTLAKHLAVPENWRILLIRSPQQAGLHGDREGTAFKNLPPVPNAVTEKLRSIAEQTILPAVENADFRSFGQGLYEYGHLSGNCFSAVQGGPFASPEISNLVDYLRNHGIQGVGQSSWGPTVFAFVEDQTAATALANHIKNHQDFATAEITITSADNQGAKTKIIPATPP